MTPNPQPPANLRPFVWVGIATMAVYALILAFYGTDPHHQGRLARELFVWPVMTLLLGLYALGYRLLKRPSAGTPRLIVTFAVALGLLTLLTTPFHSTDLFGYINRGWQQLAYGLNPYVAVVDDIPAWPKDPMFTNHWVNNPCPYGFLFAPLAKVLCYPGAGSLAVTAFLFKGFNLAVHGLIGWILWLAAKRSAGLNPERVLYLYLWNPLILLHAVANGHNDILMGVFILLAGDALIRRAWLWVIPALVAGALVKYAALILVPPALVYLIRQAGWRVALAGLALGGLLIGLTGLPYLADGSQFPLDRIGANATVTHHSLHAVLYHLYKEVAKFSPVLLAFRPTVHAALKSILWGGYAVFLVLQLAQLARKPFAPQGALSRLLLILLVGLCGASSKFYPWYLGMLFPAALLLAEGHPLRRLMVVLTGVQLYAFTVLGQAHILNYLLLVLLPIGVFAAGGIRVPRFAASPDARHSPKVLQG